MRSRGDRGHLSIKISSKPPRALCPARRSPLETVEPTKGLDKACNASVTMAVVAEKRPRRRRLRPQPPGGILDLISSGEGGGGMAEKGRIKDGGGGLRDDGS